MEWPVTENGWYQEVVWWPFCGDAFWWTLTCNIQWSLHFGHFYRFIHISSGNFSSHMEWISTKALSIGRIFSHHNLKKKINFFFWERERENGGSVRERGRHRILSRLQALSCQHGAQRGAWTHRPQDHDLRQSWTLNQLSHPGSLKKNFFLKT